MRLSRNTCGEIKFFRCWLDDQFFAPPYLPKITESVQQQGVEVINTAAMTTSMVEEEVMLRTMEDCVSQGDMRLHIRNQQA